MSANKRSVQKRVTWLTLLLLDVLRVTTVPGEIFGGGISAGDFAAGLL